MSEVPTLVEADISADSTIRPRTFTHNGVTHHVAHVGRQWLENNTRHVLVMTPARDTYELMVSMPEMQWVVKPIGSAKHVA